MRHGCLYRRSPNLVMPQSGDAMSMKLSDYITTPMQYSAFVSKNKTFLFTVSNEEIIISFRFREAENRWVVQCKMDSVSFAPIVLKGPLSAPVVLIGRNYASCELCFDIIRYYRPILSEPAMLPLPEVHTSSYIVETLNELMWARL